MLGRIAIGLTCAACLAAPAGAQVIWGVNGHPFTAYPGIPYEAQLDLVEGLGMTSYRVNISDTGPADLLEVLVGHARTRGIDILPVITPGDIDLDADEPQELYRKAHALALSLASRFKADIRVWELGNEMENYAIIQPCETRDDGTQYPCDWGPGSGVIALDYYGPRWRKVSAVLKGLSDGVAAADPNLRRAIGTAGWGHLGAFERMAEDGIAWDISVWHMYGQDPEWAFKELLRYERPIWVTEFNHPFGSENGEADQAEGLARTIVRLGKLHESYGVEAAHVYELLDEPYWAPSFEASMGLVRLEAEGDGWRIGDPKPAYAAVKEAIRGFRPLRQCDLAASAAIEPAEERLAAYAHCLLLGRDVAPEERAAWAARLRAGETSDDVWLAVLRSDEFAGRHSVLAMADRDYVAFLYRLLLGREADPHGLDSYGAELTSGAMTRTGVAFSLMKSGEFASRHGAGSLAAAN